MMYSGFDQRMSRREASLILQLAYVPHVPILNDEPKRLITGF
jgi:hypothetical protein